MKILLLLLALAVSASAQTFKDGENITNWVLMGQSSQGSLYFAPDTVRRSGDIIKVWIRADFPVGSDVVPYKLKAGHDFGSLRGYGVFNCADLTAVNSGDTLALYYDRDGRLVKRQRENERIKGDNQPTALTAIFRYFCEAVDTSPPSGPPVLRSRPNP